MDFASTGVGSNSAHTEELNWTQPAHTRTTSSIVFSCLFTILACAWCCIRPNIPSPYDSKLRILGTKLKILFWILVSPELVACWTFRQWFEAGKIAEDFKGKRRSTSLRIYLQLILPTVKGWTRKHALFLMMGGFVLTKDGLPMQAISIQLFKRLVYQGVVEFPTLTHGDIQERSKFHPIFAAIVFFQALWFAVQCLSRIATGLLITQLEVITLTLILSSAITFAFIWQKPLDIRHPILIQIPNEFDSNRLIYQPATHRVTKGDFDRERRMGRVVERIAFLEQPSQQDRPPISHFFQRLLRILVLWPVKAIFWDVCDLALGVDGLQANELKANALRIPLFYLPDSGDAMLIILPLTCVLGMGIGVVHCLFWSWGHFPSETERLLWRINSVIVAGFYAVNFVILVILGLSTFVSYRPQPRVIFDAVISAFVVFSVAFFCILLIPFVGARVILLVESFWSLRSLPEEAFKVVEWSGYIPHFS